jgi:hypothetical protein
MGFLKAIGTGLGAGIGAVFGGGAYLVGEITGSKIMKEIGEGTFQASMKAGETLGTAAGGVYDIVAGTITSDHSQVNQGLNDVGSAISETATGIKNGVENIIENGAKVVEGIKEDNFELVKEGGANLVKTAAVATLAVGVADYTGVIGDDGVSDVAADSVDGVTTTVENPNMHHVEPHWVNGYERADGTYVEGYWRDGDGDTSVNNGTGWMQHNPDLKSKA